MDGEYDRLVNDYDEYRKRKLPERSTPASS
jgi:hypothetical protein